VKTDGLEKDNRLLTETPSFEVEIRRDHHGMEYRQEVSPLREQDKPKQSRLCSQADHTSSSSPNIDKFRFPALTAVRADFNRTD
jgi:hypothetical protein